MTVDEMLHRISSRELTEWQVYATIEPFGGEQMTIANQSALLANIHRDRKTQRTPFAAPDFLLWSYETPSADEASEPETMTEPEREAVAHKVAAMLGAPI